MWPFVKKIVSNATSYPEWYSLYWQNYHKPAANLPISEVNFTVIDTETTGLDSTIDHILSIGALKIYQNEMNLKKVFSHRIRQSHVVKRDEVISIHGLIQTEKTGRDLDRVIPELFAFLNSSVLIGHHVNFDRMMINRTSKLLRGGPVLNYVLDTAILAQRLDNPHMDSIVQKEQYTLDALCRRFNIITKDRHTALGDAYLTALVFLKLVSALEKRGISMLGDLKPQQGTSNFKLKIF